MSEAAETKEKESDKPNPSHALNRFVGLIDGKELSQGDVADLRRLRPGDPSCMAFWRLVAVALEPYGVLSENLIQRQAQEQRWAAAAAAIVRARGLHAGRRGLGEALASARFAELRFVRLLRATEDSLWDEARKAATYLASKGEHFDHRQLVDLILSDDEQAVGGGAYDRRESVRRRIARDYFRHAPRD